MLLGCFRSVAPGDAPEVDAGTADARPAARDAAPPSDSGVDLGPTGECTCVDESVCGEPPPFGCGRAVCVFESSCEIRADDSGCGAGARCETTSLECADDVSTVGVVLRTDYEPGVDFDGIALRADGVVVALRTPSAGEDYLDGVRLGDFGTAATTVELELALYRGCRVVATQRSRPDVEPEGTSVTMVVTGR